LHRSKVKRKRKEKRALEILNKKLRVETKENFHAFGRLLKSLKKGNDYLQEGPRRGGEKGKLNREVNVSEDQGDRSDGSLLRRGKGDDIFSLGHQGGKEGEAWIVKGDDLRRL